MKLVEPEFVFDHDGDFAGRYVVRFIQCDSAVVVRAMFADGEESTVVYDNEVLTLPGDSFARRFVERFVADMGLARAIADARREFRRLPR